MKWVWWIGGAFAYIVYKNEIGTGTMPHYVAQVVILLVASLMGQRADRLRKEAITRELDRQAEELRLRLDRENAGRPADRTRASD